jgi:gliding motility-associated-like protein
MMIHGDWVYTDGIFDLHFVGSNGCDSVVYDTLQFVAALPPSSGLLYHICYGDSIYLGGHFQYSAGNYSTHFISSGGCDSTVIDTLDVYPVNPIHSGNVYYHCSGVPISIGGIMRNAAGIYFDTLQDWHGCDSVIADTLREWSNYRTSGGSYSICHGESIFLHGHSYNRAGIYIDSLSSIYGCDSLVYDSLYVLPIPMLPGMHLSICPGASILLHGHLLSSAGIFMDTLSAIGRCDSIFVDTISLLPNSISSGKHYHICPGDSLNINGQFYNTAQLIHDTLMNAYGCDSILIDTLTLLASPMADAGPDAFISSGESVRITGHGGPPFVWSTGLHDSLLLVSPLSDTFYILTVFNDSNCSSTDTVHVHVSPKDAHLQAPDAFTPNGDGINDRFTVFGQGIATYDISIFNRWGELIYHSSDPGELNNTAKGWDGTFMQQEQLIGTYIFAIHYSSSDAKKFFVQGSLSLIR